MKRTGSCLLSTLLVLGTSLPVMAGAYGETGTTTEAPAASPAPEAAVTEAKVESNFDRAGGYLQVGGVYTVQNFDSNADIKGIPLDDASNTGGYEIRAGYHINRMFALEAEWEHYLHYKDVAPSADLHMWGITVNGKFYPIGGRFQPYLLLGIGVAKAEFESSTPAIGKVDEAGFATRFGLGVDIYITESVGVAFEAGYLLPFNDAHEFDNIPFSGSLYYRFG